MSFFSGGVHSEGSRDAVGNLNKLVKKKLPKQASEIAIPDSLLTALGDIRPTTQTGIKQTYSNLGASLSADRKARGLSSGGDSYSPGRLAFGQGQDLASLDSTLGGVLGDTAYKDYQSQNEYDQNLQLANEIANLNKPSELEQALAALGAIGGPVAAFAGARKGKAAPGASKTSYQAYMSPDYAYDSGGIFNG